MIRSIADASGGAQGITFPWERSYPPGLDWRRPPPARPLPELLEEAAATHRDRSCMDFLGRRHSFGETLDRVERTAKGLQELGVGEGTRVMLLLPNCPYFVIAFYAILKAGGTVVNANPLNAELELERQIADSAAEILITLDLPRFQTTLSAVGWPGRLRRIIVASLAESLPFPKNWLYPLFHREDIADFPDDGRHLSFSSLLANDGRCVPIGIDPQHAPAVIQYTGGTTGLPKGTVLTHAGLSVNACQCRDWLTGSAVAQERLLAVLPLFHVFGMTAVMNFGIALGAELVLLPRIDVREILATIQSKRPTIMTGVPRLFQALIDCPTAARHDLSSLRLCISGGDSLPPLLQERFQAMTGSRLVEGYGLTEASPVVTCTPYDGATKPGSAGLPLPGTIVEIVSVEDGTTPLPVGRVGEVCVRGPQLMAGYWSDDEATARALAGGHLHTGDIGFLDEDGYLHIVDRLKDLIIAGGQHVYPRVVEAAIREHPAVSDVAVIGEPDPVRGQTVKAFVVVKPGAGLSAGDLHSFLVPRLSRFERPSTIEFRSALPTSIIGKILKRDLRSATERPGPPDL
ncbi:long-chain fatty acid--CoA ligase [Azospirillum sp. TSO35-2]|uniref:long-chain-fatty-acid--CoA ligase n=1 Tax=Azospirillum sp. TSO35-2 TaxID=716796 RepID=UPI000D60FAE2|nr:long-chain fatty acid--CoA ligase [Azospirillum sp. TSO35-2]PWC39823.1 hypothetical protein TSO352_07020 [Azospirillum sp. TSO35-2]